MSVTSVPSVTTVTSAPTTVDASEMTTAPPKTAHGTTAPITAPSGTAALVAAVLDTPPGPLGVIVDDDRIVAAGYSADLDALHVRLGPLRRDRPIRRLADLGVIGDALHRYHGGELDALDSLTVDQPGTEHQQAIWRALRAVPAGRTVTYSELAAMAGNADAVRAAGTACGRNLVAPIVPCHRAVRRDGTLGGYYYGLDVKRWLLDHESGARLTGPRSAA